MIFPLVNRVEGCRWVFRLPIYAVKIKRQPENERSAVGVSSIFRLP